MAVRSQRTTTHGRRRHVFVVVRLRTFLHRIFPHARLRSPLRHGHHFCRTNAVHSTHHIGAGHALHGLPVFVKQYHFLPGRCFCHQRRIASNCNKKTRSRRVFQYRATSTQAAVASFFCGLAMRDTPRRSRASRHVSVSVSEICCILPSRVT